MAKRKIAYTLGRERAYIFDISSTSGYMGATYFQEFGPRFLTCPLLVGTWVKNIFRNLVPDFLAHTPWRVPPSEKYLRKGGHCTWPHSFEAVVGASIAPGPTRGAPRPSRGAQVGGPTWAQVGGPTWGPKWVGPRGAQARNLGPSKNPKHKNSQNQNPFCPKCRQGFSSRKKTFLAPFGALPGNFLRGPAKIQNLPIFLGGPMGPIHPLWAEACK